MITPTQCRMARAALRIGVRDLGEMAGISPMTVTRFETDRSGGQATTLRQIQAAFEAAGIEFLPDEGRGPGVRHRS